MKYVFIIFIYLFIYWIARLIYLDIVTMDRFRRPVKENQPYLKLINRRDQLNFKVEETYFLADKTTVGRSPKNDIVLPDPYISGEHALLSFAEGAFMIEDLGSTNGTLVNGRKLQEPALLTNGDRISFGKVDFLFVLGRK